MYWLPWLQTSLSWRRNILQADRRIQCQAEEGSLYGHLEGTFATILALELMMKRKNWSSLSLNMRLLLQQIEVQRLLCSRLIVDRNELYSHWFLPFLLVKNSIIIPRIHFHSFPPFICLPLGLGWVGIDYMASNNEAPVAACLQCFWRGNDVGIGCDCK